MKNNILNIFLFFFIFFNFNLSAEELEINSSKVQHDNLNKVTIFEGNVNSIDSKGNKFFSEYAQYNKIDGIIKTKGNTKIITAGGFEATGKNVILDNKKKLIYSNYKTQIEDKDGNKITVDMFNYSTLTSIFFSKGNIKVVDRNKNIYNFSEIYIDEKKKKILGSDARVFLVPDSVSAGKDSNPRFFANTMSLSDGKSTLNKGVFTSCKNREGEKCPPWVLQSDKITHDLAKKTIYYDNVILKIYDFPIFYSPKFSHPDPTVKRTSGFLAPILTNSNTIGAGFGAPYFFNIASDKDITLTPKFFLKDNPLFLAEYRQDFMNSFLIVDTGYTQGYKKTDNKKTSGGRAHFFSKFNKSLIDEDEKKSSLEITTQKVSNDTYFQVYDFNTSLVKEGQKVLENTINFNYQNNDFSFNFLPSVYEDTSKLGNLRHEYLLPLTIEKNLMVSEKYGFADLTSNIKLRNYDINKQTNFFVNDFNWKSNKWLSKFGFSNHLEGLIKTVNYEADNTNEYKNESTNSELNTALGYFAKLGLYKNDVANKNIHTLTPKFLLRYSPGHMREINDGKLNYGNLFKLDKVNKIDVVENGLSTSIGFEYKKNKLNAKKLGKEIFSFSAGQVISKEDNLDMPSSSTLDQRFSDIVGTTKYNVNEKVKLNYNFSVDQGYKNINYNEIGTELELENVKFNLNYLEEKKYIGNQEFVQSGVEYKINNSTELSFSTKRNILTKSAEFYNLSYNYLNDCLKAGIGYRREFYTDRDIEPANTLMFTISIIPLGKINSSGLLSK
jgi:LPS-assembly protein